MISHVNFDETTQTTPYLNKDITKDPKRYMARKSVVNAKM